MDIIIARIGERICNEASKHRWKQHSRKSIAELISEKDTIEKKIVELQNEIYRHQIQKDILEKADELLKKKAALISIKLSNKEKSVLINALRNYYLLKDLPEE